MRGNKAVSAPDNAVQAGFVESAVEQIFQTMYFSRPVYRGPGRVEASATGSTIGFSGAANGEVRVLVSEDLARRMTADFLALDAEEVTRDRVEAMVKEFANVACGAIMGAWMPGGDFHFSVPHELSSDGGPAEFEHCFSVSEEAPEFAIGIALCGG